MLRVTVKKRRRKILEISDDLCRYYPDDLDIPVSFSLCEIAQIERCDNRTETMVYLRDAVGQTILPDSV